MNKDDRQIQKALFRIDEAIIELYCFTKENPGAVIDILDEASFLLKSLPSWIEELEANQLTALNNELEMELAQENNKFLEKEVKLNYGA